MKRILGKWCLLLTCFLALGLVARADGFHTDTFTAAGTGAPVPNIGTGISYHKITWTNSGTVSGCTIALDTSADGVTWSSGGAITGQTCTSNGASAVVNVTANFVRANMTALTGTSPSVAVTWNGYVNNPAGGAGTLLFGATVQNLNNSPATASGQCLVSTGSGPYAWVAGACSGSASTNWSALSNNAANVSNGTYLVGTGSGLGTTGTGTIAANSLTAGVTSVPVSSTAPVAGNIYGFNGTNLFPFNNQVVSSTAGAWGPALDLCSSQAGTACNDSTDDTNNLMNNVFIPCNTSGTCNLVIGGATQNYLKVQGYTSTVTGAMTISNNTNGDCSATNCSEITFTVGTTPPAWVTPLAPVIPYPPAAYSGLTCVITGTTGTFPFSGYPWQVVSTTSTTITVATPSCNWNSGATSFTPTSGSVGVGLWSDAKLMLQGPNPTAQNTATIASGFDSANSPIVIFTSVPCLNTGAWSGVTCPTGKNSQAATIRGLNFKCGTSVSHGASAGILFYGNNTSEISGNNFQQCDGSSGDQVAPGSIILAGPVSLQGSAGFDQNNHVFNNSFASGLGVTTWFQSSDNWIENNHGIGNQTGTSSPSFGNFIDVCYSWNVATGATKCGGVSHILDNISENYSIHNIIYGQQKVDFRGKGEKTTSCVGGNCTADITLALHSVTGGQYFVKSLTNCVPLHVDTNSTNIHITTLDNSGDSAGSCGSTGSGTPITTDGGSYSAGTDVVDSGAQATFSMDAINSANGVSTYAGPVRPSLNLGTAASTLTAMLNVQPITSGLIAGKFTGSPGSDDVLRVNEYNGGTPTTAFKVTSAGVAYLPLLATGSTVCLQLSSAGAIGVAAAACGSGGGGALPGGSPTDIQYQVNSTTFGGASNYTYTSGTGVVTLNQLANGNQTLYGTRFTDTTPTGNFIDFQNAAASSDLFKVDASGNATMTGFTLTGQNSVIWGAANQANYSKQAVYGGETSGADTFPPVGLDMFDGLGSNTAKVMMDQAQNGMICVGNVYQSVSAGHCPTSSSTGTGIYLAEGTAPISVTGLDAIYADSIAHAFKVCLNGAACTSLGGNTRTWRFDYSGVCQAGVSSAPIGLPTTNAPQLVACSSTQVTPQWSIPAGDTSSGCSSGTVGACTWAFWVHLVPPAGVTSGSSVYTLTSTYNTADTNTGHSASIQPYYACVAAGSSSANPSITSIGSAQSFPGTATQVDTAVTGTITPTCAAGNTLFVEWTVTSNTLTSALNFSYVGVSVTGSL